MASWLTDIVTALSNLGGKAHYEQIYAEIERLRSQPLPPAWKKIVQRAVQDHAGESDGYKKTKRLFYSINGKGSGVWGLVDHESRSSPSTSDGRANKLRVEAAIPTQIGTTKRNPKWSRDELVLALELYIRQRSNPVTKDSLEVAQLSVVLNRLAEALQVKGASDFRNQNGVYMKLMNFRRFDPLYTGAGMVGLTRGNKDEELVWQEFSNDIEHLQKVVATIHSAIDGDLSLLVGDQDELGVVEAEEGRVFTRLHRVRERDRALIENYKKVVLKDKKKLICSACDFDFFEQYGAPGQGIIDVHHTKPVHTMKPGDKTTFEDLVLLCANCHRFVHSSRKWKTIEEVRMAIHAAKNIAQ